MPSDPARSMWNPKRRAPKGEVYDVIGENASINRITAAIGREVPDMHGMITPTQI